MAALLIGTNLDIISDHGVRRTRRAGHQPQRNTIREEKYKTMTTEPLRAQRKTIREEKYKTMTTEPLRAQRKPLEKNEGRKSSMRNAGRGGTPGKFYIGCHLRSSAIEDFKQEAKKAGKVR